MQITNPVTAYLAANNLEVRSLQMILEDAGILTLVMEDICQTEFGFSPMVHQPKILVDASQLEQAKLILHAYEDKIRLRKIAEEKLAKNFKFSPEECLTINCEFCLQDVSFPRILEGTIQSCPACKKNIDVEIYAQE